MFHAEWRTDNPVRPPERVSPRPAFGWIHGLTDRIVRPPQLCYPGHHLVTPVTGSIRIASDSARMRFVRAVAGAFCLLAALCLVASVPKGMAPLPGQYLKGHTSYSPDGWFPLESQEWRE